MNLRKNEIYFLNENVLRALEYFYGIFITIWYFCLTEQVWLEYDNLDQRKAKSFGVVRISVVHDA